jgi:hypothetical protein
MLLILVFSPELVPPGLTYVEPTPIYIIPPPYFVDELKADLLLESEF